MRCLEWGDSDASSQDGTRPVVLLLHGLTSCAETWNLVAPMLAAEARVLAPDLRGHGETDKPDQGYDHESLRRDVEGLLEGLGVEQAAVVGHSWGAGVAATLAADLPHLATHLALMEGGFFGRDGRGEPTPERLEQMLAPPEIYASKERYLAEVQAHLPAPWTPDLEEIALASVYQNADGSVREKLSREHQKEILRVMWGARPQERYTRVGCPTMVIAAETAYPAAAERMARKRAGVEETARLLPRCTVRWVPDSVHDLQLHRPEVVAAALREFLKTDR